MFVLSAAALGPVQALGVGRPLTLSALGQSLNLVFPVRLASGETLSLDCVRAEVLAGESRVPANLIQLQLEGEGEAAVRAVRLQSLVQVDEPLVTINLSLGCPARFTRQYIAFIDPPGAATTPAAVPEPVLRQYSPALSAALATAQAMPEALLAPGQAPASAASAPPVAKPVAKAPSRPRRPARSPKPSPAPMLMLEPAEVLAAAPAASAASAAAAASAPDAATQARLAQLEQTLLKLQAENQATRQELKLVSQRLVEAQSAGSQGPWVYALGLLSLMLAGSSLYFWRSRRGEQLSQESAWWDQARSERAADPVAPAEPSKPAVPTAAVPAAGAAPAAVEVMSHWGALTAQDEPTLALPSLVAAVAPSLQPPVVAALKVAPEPIGLQLVDAPPAGTLVSDVPANNVACTVTVEELIDLEQQIDFFMVLGQDAAAIELLESRLQGSGAEVALPHLKLLEVLQRRGDEAAFAIAAQRYAAAFGISAPAWGPAIGASAGLQAQSSTLALLQACWRDSGACMALLQRLLTGSPQGSGLDGGLLDLQSYRELLMLYGVARDLSEHEVRGDEIDLFLPLDTPGSSGMMATMAWQPPASQRPPQSQTLEVDISLDEPERP
ncbi:hypothetical protein OOZ63_21905 [Paucibacter sp. PLA-PC-4]|uniref:type IV pilus assembly protein FimV n=1 Tax=Paucibacter sp. PLA-PC-4 TaxID=2993655 RepID=UPI00224AE138|nr:hypothetical protein [Paucibacter sp. PLA-PC-4]MCX2864489.1 hypothetical protein [Paucibacter sp. PLA-PC-4]